MVESLPHEAIILSLIHETPVTTSNGCAPIIIKIIIIINY